MPHRLRQILLVVSALWLSWLAMMLVHESGHVMGALLTGGHVQRVVWHPAVLSRTDVRPNPRPLIEVWAGPLIGSLIPLLLASLAAAMRLVFAYLIWVAAGFCLVANGAYIGCGAFHPIGDAAELVAHGTPRWSLAAFGAVAVLAGFWIWDRVSPRLGFGKSPQPIHVTHVWASVVLAVAATLLGITFGNRGL